MGAAKPANIGETENTLAYSGSCKMDGDTVFAGSNCQNETGQSHGQGQERNFELIDSLYSAAAEGDIEKFKEHGPILHQLLTPNENTILHIHITARPKMVKLINIFGKKQSEESGISSKCFVSEILELCPELLWKANTEGETLLLIAARHGHAVIANILIDECKKHHQKDQENGIEAARLMLGKTNEAKDTALHEAVRFNHLDVVKILTKEDPDLSYGVNSAGETPLYLAAERGYKDVAKEILATCTSPADQGPIGRTALHAAVISKDREITKMLLENKRSLTSKADQEGWVPLHCAAYMGCIHITKELLNADKSAAYKADNEGKTAFHVAAERGKVVIMQEIILRCPGCCELVDKRGWNIFHFALHSKNQKAVQLLLKNSSLGNLVNKKDNKGNKPLHQLAASGSYMPSFIRHPKVDTLAFNHQNQNATYIILAKGLISTAERSVLWCLYRAKSKRGCGVVNFNDEGPVRILVSKDEGEEGKERDDNISNKSDDGKKRNKIDDVLEKYIKKSKDSNLVVAALIATVTFTAGITLPGGYIDEKGPDQGAAVLTSSKSFQAFVISNTIAMIFSSCAVFIHLFISRLTNKVTDFYLWKLSLLFIIYAMFAMVLAFVMCTYAVLQCAKEIAISVCVIASLFFLVHTCYEPHLMLENMVNKVLAIIYMKLRTEFISRVHLRRR